MTIDDMPAVLTVDQVARILGISRGLAFAAVNNGTIPALRIGRRILVPRTRLVQLIEGDSAAGRTTSSPDGVLASDS